MKQTVQTFSKVLVLAVSALSFSFITFQAKANDIDFHDDGIIIINNNQEVCEKERILRDDALEALIADASNIQKLLDYSHAESDYSKCFHNAMR